MDDKLIKKYILRCTAFLMICFLALIGNVVYLQVIEADTLAANSMNRRSSAGNGIVRGSIVDDQGRVLAGSQTTEDRYYPYGAIMAPVTGYLGTRIGSAGVESIAGDALAGESRELKNLGPIAQLIQSEKGNTVKLTVDADIQQLIYDSMGEHKGAAVVMDADTGAIIAMVSKPSVNPGIVEQGWTELNQDEDSPLLNRVSQGLYPPGSTIKVMIADAALDEKVTDMNEVFDCTGKLQIGNEYIRESHSAVHGMVNLKAALAESCNVTFGTLAMRMHGKGLADAFARFGFNKNLDCEIPEALVHLPGFTELNEGDTAQIGIGQGELLVTPLRMAMLASAYVNGGVIMKPYLINEIISPTGVIINKKSPSKWLEVTSAQRAGIISAFMESVVTDGTGGAAQVPGVRVTGKTGTAENSAGADHGWFIGTAELPNRKIAFSIILENSGGGGTTAAPIARQIILTLLGNRG